MLYTVTYLSIFDEPYLETKLCFTKEEADQQMLEWVKDICETESWTLEEVDFEVGDMVFEENSCGHIYRVQMDIHNKEEK